jgi:hypothetical protein
MELGEQRDQLLEMAANWDRMAADHAAFIQMHPELALGGEHAEEERRDQPQGS